MFGIGIPELLLILALALIVLGPDKLPQVARQIARYLGELKRASEELKSQIDMESIEKDIDIDLESDIKDIARRQSKALESDLTERDPFPKQFTNNNHKDDIQNESPEKDHIHSPRSDNQKKDNTSNSKDSP
jgi:Tat protein translocase TatB subunit